VTKSRIDVGCGYSKVNMLSKVERGENREKLAGEVIRRII